ncbi:MobA/MobL family protein [Microvirga sp. VF16]|uniref:MobA/MobL family protein n=1 Tax=Microvirga sp. VF16 TaxID=2807101 RepID=UPI00193E6221|nr:MobA/MobL family protein [Microvirga sp. VF16]
MSTVKRAQGRSALAASAYIACQRLKDRLTGEVFDFRRKAGLHCAFVVAPDECKVDREVLWNAAEAAETRSNSVVARSTILALPHELDQARYASLVRKHARYLAERHGVAVDVAIHLPGKEGDERNFHAHLLLTTREVAIGPAGDVICGKKTRKLDEHRTGSAIINEWRLHWQDCVNEALHHLGVQIDVRSYAKQGLDRVAEEHLGPARTNLDRRATREILEEVRTARLIYLDAVSADGRWRRFGLEARRRRTESAAAAPSKQEFGEYLERQEEAQTDEPLFTSVGKVTDPLISQEDSTETMPGLEGTAVPDGASAGRAEGPMRDNELPISGEGEPPSDQEIDCPSDPVSKAVSTTMALGSPGNDGADAQESAGDGPEIPPTRTPSLEASVGLKPLSGSPATQGEQDQQSLIPHGEESDNSVEPIAYRGGQHVPEAVGELRHSAGQAHSHADVVGPESVTAPVRNMIERLRAVSEAAREREAVKRSIEEQIAADRRSPRSPSKSAAANSPAANPLTGGPAMQLPLMQQDAGGVGGMPRSGSSRPASKEAPTQSPQVGSTGVLQSDRARTTKQTALGSEPTVAELIAKGQGRPIRSVPSQDASALGASITESVGAPLEGKTSANIEAPSRPTRAQDKVVSPASVFVQPPTSDMKQQDASSDIKGIGQVSGEKQQLALTSQNLPASSDPISAPKIRISQTASERSQALHSVGAPSGQEPSGNALRKPSGTNPSLSSDVLSPIHGQEVVRAVHEPPAPVHRTDLGRLADSPAGIIITSGTSPTSMPGEETESVGIKSSSLPDEPAVAQTKNTAAGPGKSPAPTPASSAAKAPAPNNPRFEAGIKPVVAENSHQPSRPAVNNVPKPENAAPGTEPARDNSGSAVSKPATAAPAPSAPAQAQRPAAAQTDAKPGQTQAPSRPAQAPAAPSVRPTAPQIGSAKEPATTKVTSAPAAAPEKAPAPAPAQAPTPRTEPARPTPRAETSTGKPDGAKAATEAKAPARPERAFVAPKPSTAELGPARTPGERSGEGSDAKPAKEKAEIRVGNPLSPVTPKQIEPIRVEGTKPPKKPKRRGKGRDEGPSM